MYRLYAWLANQVCGLTNAGLTTRVWRKCKELESASCSDLYTCPLPGLPLASVDCRLTNAIEQVDDPNPQQTIAQNRSCQKGQWQEKHPL